MHRTSIVPKATSNLVKAKSDIDEYGYCLIENALEPAVVDAALSRLKEQAAAELELGAAFEDGCLHRRQGTPQTAGLHG